MTAPALVFEFVPQLDILVQHTIRTNGDGKTWCGREPWSDQSGLPSEEVWFGDHDRPDAVVVCPRCGASPILFLAEIRVPRLTNHPPQQDDGSLAIAIEELTDGWFKAGTHVIVIRQEG